MTLPIQAEPLQCTFGISGTDGERQILATGETRYLAPEVARGFTGAYFALYASGNRAQASVPAFFEWFDFRIATQD